MEDEVKVTEKAEGSEATEEEVAIEDREVTCPSCLRFVGTYEKCPYCGAKVFKRLSVRAFRWGSLVFAFVGLFLLWIAARGIKAPLKSVHEITPNMSMANLRVEGRITNAPSLHPEWGSLYVQLDDGTGRIAISAYKEVAEIIMKDVKPHMGDSVSVQGMIRVVKDKARLLCQDPRHFKMIKRAPGPAAAKEMNIADVKAEMKGQSVIVQGTLARSGVLPFGAYKGTLEDDSGSSVIVWVTPQKWPNFNSVAKSRLTTGAKLRVRGAVVPYFDKRLAKTVLEVVLDGRDGCVETVK